MQYLRTSDDAPSRSIALDLWSIQQVRNPPNTTSVRATDGGQLKHPTVSWVVHDPTNRPAVRPVQAPRLPLNGMQSEQIRLFVIDDDASITAVLERLVDYGFVICGLARPTIDVLGKLRRERPHIVLVEISAESSSDLPLVRSVRGEFPGIAIVAYSRLPEAAHAERALHAGALCYVSKKASFDDLLQALRAAKEGEACFSAGTMRRMMTNMVRNRRVGVLRKLTARETSVFEMLGDGRNLANIANELGLTRKTVGIYRRRIKDKLSIDSASELTEYARNWRRSDPAARSLFASEPGA